MPRFYASLRRERAPSTARSTRRDLARSSFSSSSASASESVAEGVEVQRLVRAVRAGVRILDPGDEDLRAGEVAHQVGDERDGAADADVDGFDAIALVQRLAGCRDRPAAGVDEERVAVVLVDELELRAERRVRAQMRLDRRIRVAARPDRGRCER